MFLGINITKIISNLPDLLTTNDIQYRVGNHKKFSKEIPDARVRKRFNANVDILISEILRGRDPGAASTVQEGLSRIHAGKPKRRRPAKRKVRKDQRGIKDSDLEISDIEKAKFSPKQLGLQFGKKTTVKPDKFGIQGRAQKVRMATTGWLGSAGKVVWDVDEAASLLAPIRKSAQEYLYTVGADQNGLIHESHKYSKGLKSAAPSSDGEVEAHIFRIDGAPCAHFTRTSRNHTHYVCKRRSIYAHPRALSVRTEQVHFEWNPIRVSILE